MKLVHPSDPVLWTPAAHVRDIAAEVHPHVPDMRTVMWQQSNGVAMAAPQVGIGLRFFITTGRFLPSVVINPVIAFRSAEMVEGLEGCFSRPGEFIKVLRHEAVEVAFQNYTGQVRSDRFTGLAARIFQHEFDHLEGKCIFPRPMAGGGA